MTYYVSKGKTDSADEKKEAAEGQHGAESKREFRVVIGGDGF
jgi:hypothetical protein